MASPILKITTLNEKPHTRPVDQPRITVGRQAGCDVVLSDKLVSARHAEIFKAGGKYMVRDLGSTNGVYVNGIRRLEFSLASGDRIRIGSSIIELLVPTDREVEEFAQTDRTVIDPFAITISPAQIEAELLEGARGDDPSIALIRQKLTVLYRLGQDASAIDDMNVWLGRVAQLVRETLGPERISVLVFDRPVTSAAAKTSASEARPLFALDWTAAEPDQPVYVPPSFLTQIVEEQKAVLYEAADHEPRFRSDPEMMRIPIRALMAAPLMSARGVVGVLYIDRSSQTGFAVDDLHILGLIANQCAVMIENVRLFGEVRRAFDQLRVAHNDLRTTQEQLLHVAKLSALGETVAGIAHEINNPLTGVLGYAQLLLNDPNPSQAEVREYVTSIAEDAQRVKRIVGKLLAFGRRGTSAFARVSVNDVVTTALGLKAHDFRRDVIAIEVDLDPALPPVEGSASELEQVLVNLLQNASQALAEKGGGRISVTTRLVGEKVEVVVADDGPGIPASILPKIFDPFFTTKPVGEGTGLGLSISFAIMKRHGGEIIAESPAGQGATFRLLLPAHTGPISSTSIPAMPRQPSVAAESGRRVLVVEDEETIRKLTASFLTKRGFEVVAASGCKKAIDVLQREAAFDLIICDLRLPDGSGRLVYDEALRLNPWLTRQVLFITGDVTNPECARLEEEHPGSVITKPFNLADLEQRIQSVLQRPD